MLRRGVCSKEDKTFALKLTFDSVDKVEMCQKRDSHKASTEKNFVAILSLLTLDTGYRKMST